MTKIVYNACFGGFGLSEAAMRLYAEKKGLPFFVWKDPAYKTDYMKQYFTADPSGMTVMDQQFYKKYSLYDNDIERTDPVLVEVVEELGDKANGAHAKLRVVEIDEGTLYRIDEYDGNESVETMYSYDWRRA